MFIGAGVCSVLCPFPKTSSVSLYGQTSVASPVTSWWMPGSLHPLATSCDGVCGVCVGISSSRKSSLVSFSRPSLLPSVCVLSLPRVSPGLCGPLSSRAGAPLQHAGLPDARAGRGPQLSLPPQQHSNASQSLCDIIRLSREQMIQVQDSPEPDQLLTTLEKWVAGSPRQWGGAVPGPPP